MKRRNAETGKLRRPVKRTKITEGMYGNSLLYLKFALLWAAVVMADYLLEFRFEFLWPFWMMVRSVYDSFKYQGLAFSIFFICIALTSDLICFFFIPLQYVFFAASTYVWVQYIWYTLCDKGVCLPTVAVCCVLVYVEGALRPRSPQLEFTRPLAAHCVGYPVVTLGFGVKSFVGQRLRLRRQRAVRKQNEFYFQLLRDALPDSEIEQSQQTQQQPQQSQQSKEPASTVSNGECIGAETDCRANGTLRRTRHQLDKVEKEKQNLSSVPVREKPAHANAHAHAHSNGSAAGAGAATDAHDTSKGSAKSSKCEKKEASNLKEEKRKKNKDKDKDNHSDSHNNKNTEQTKEQIVKEVEITKENHIRDRNHKECHTSKERERDREREREHREREREKDRERERERERELREIRELQEELKRVKAALAAAVRGEAAATRALAHAALGAQEHHKLKAAHAALQHKVSAWRSGERAVLERRLGEERRARTHAEHQLLRARHQANSANSASSASSANSANCATSASTTPPQAASHSGECESAWCLSVRGAATAECGALRAELRRVRERADLAQRDLARALDQVRSLEARAESAPGPQPASLTERATHLERALSAETRVKLDLLSALGCAKRQITIQEGLISRQEKQLEELKAQMLAVMPTEYVTSNSGTVSKLRLEGSPLDPNASVYTPKQLCSDA